MILKGFDKDLSRFRVWAFTACLELGVGSVKGIGMSSLGFQGLCVLRAWGLGVQGQGCLKGFYKGSIKV